MEETLTVYILQILLNINYQWQIATIYKEDKIMKKSLLKTLALALAMIMVAGSFAACSKQKDVDDNQKRSDEEDDGIKTSDEVEGADTLVVGYDNFSSKFSPFFATTGYDMDVVDITSIGLLTLDREGNVVLQGSKGATIPYNGKDYTYYGISDVEITQNADGTVYYDFILRDDIKFSDGEKLTIDDVIFSMYVFSDPTYDGSSTFYAQPIVGMEEYRSGMEAVSNLIIAAGKDNTDFTYFTEDQQKSFWDAVDKAGVDFAQDIVDYCVAEYSDYLEAVANSEVALGMYVWGFGTPSEDGTKITGNSGTEYDTATVTTADYWNEINLEYAGDIKAASDTETATNDLFNYIWLQLGDEASEYQKGVNTGESAPNIAGIEKTGDNSLRITMSKYDATAIYNIGVTVAPLHYYGSEDAYDYDNNKYGFTKGDLSAVKSKTTQPLGAGPYVFQSYQNGVITFTANEGYFKGEPKIKTLLFKETSDADKLAGVKSGAFDIANPSMSVAVLDAIKGYNSNGEIIGDSITTSMVDNLGYGYIGINAKNVKVGDDQASAESKSLRKAFATMFAIYRDTVIKSYYGEMATVIQYPISNTSWAAPKPADDGYAIAYSKDVEGNDIYTANMTDEQKYEAALNAAIGFLKDAGYTWDEASSTFTAAPAGASMIYEIIIPANGGGDHPAYGILTAVKEALAQIGLTLEINDPSDSNVLWNSNDAGTTEMWVAAWEATPDPDMYQVYYSTNVVEGTGTKSNSYHIQDDQLDALIMEGRESADQSFRKSTYKAALGVIMDWAVEIPTYQRQNGIIFSTERVDIDTITTDITPYWTWINEIQTIKMK